MRGDGIMIRLTKKEKAEIKVLKEKHAVNVSQYLRNKIGELYEKLEKK